MMLASSEPKSFFRYLQFSLILLVFVLAGLQIPRISNLVFLAIVPLALMNDCLGFPRLLMVEKLLKKNYLGSLILLILFSLVYFSGLEYYNLNSIDSNNAVIINSLRLVIYYVLGSCLNYPRLPFYCYNFSLMLLALIGSSTIFIFLCVTKLTFASLVLFSINESNIPSYWDGQDLQIRNVDMYNSLTLSLFPLVVFGKSKLLKIKDIYNLICIPLLLIIPLAIYSVIALRGRAPVIVFIVSLGAATILVLSKNNKHRIRLFASIFVCFFLLVLFTDLREIANQISSQRFFERLESQGLDTPRYEIWTLVLSNIFDYPFGGKQFALPTGTQWAHNLWLDTIYEAGIVPFVLLIAFQFSHIKAFLKVLSSNQLPTIVSLSVLGLTIAFGLTFMIQPVMAASVVYFALFCFLLGAVRRLADELSLQEERQRKEALQFPVFDR